MLSCIDTSVYIGLKDLNIIVFCERIGLNLDKNSVSKLYLNVLRDYTFYARGIRELKEKGEDEALKKKQDQACEHKVKNFRTKIGLGQQLLDNAPNEGSKNSDIICRMINLMREEILQHK